MRESKPSKKQAPTVLENDAMYRRIHTSHPNSLLSPLLSLSLSLSLHLHRHYAYAPSAALVKSLEAGVLARAHSFPHISLSLSLSLSLSRGSFHYGERLQNRCPCPLPLSSSSPPPPPRPSQTPAPITTATPTQVYAILHICLFLHNASAYVQPLSAFSFLFWRRGASLSSRLLIWEARPGRVNTQAPCSLAGG